jgi:hypothetical protein
MLYTLACCCAVHVADAYLGAALARTGRVLVMLTGIYMYGMQLQRVGLHVFDAHHHVREPRGRACADRVCTRVSQSEHHMPWHADLPSLPMPPRLP